MHSPGNQRQVQRDRFAIRAKIDDCCAMLARNVPTARKLLRDALDEPIKVTPENGGFRFAGRADMGRLLTGTAWNQASVPTGD